MTENANKRPHPQSATILESAMAAMTNFASPALFDVTIICTTDDFQAAYWMDRLSSGICKKSESSTDAAYPMVLAVSEDWASSSGAGNGLGTLYAFQKACRVAKDKYGVDLASELMEEKVSAALYHTAGKGTRLAPLPASENNNKPGVKLPVTHTLTSGAKEPITVLEAVVRQTGIYASSRLGRLSVFWGDQIFVPTAPFQYTPTHHVDIMCTLEGEGDEPPTEKEWTERGLDKYGVIAVAKGESGDAAQVEKVDHPTAVRMLKNLGDIGRVGPSLGSFSVSAKVLEALCDEFKEELTAKDGKLDTDPHFWMPLTLPQEEYISLMSQKGVAEDESRTHHIRMTKMKESFLAANPELGLFGAVDVGSDACWWDYGQLKLYIANNLKLAENGADADLLRRFFGVTSRVMDSEVEGVTIDESSCVFACKAKSGSVGAHSAMAAVQAEEIQIGDDAIVVNCAAKKIVAGKGAVLYNLVSDSEEGIVAEDGDVLVSVTDVDGKSMLLRSKIDVCGGQAWKKVLDGNTVSFEDVHKQNRDADITVIEQKRKELYKKASDSFNL